MLVGVCVGTVAAYAQDATWLLNPGSTSWTAAANWAPAIVPTGTATFGASNTTTITFTNTIGRQVGTLQFSAGAPAYSFNIGIVATVKITGAGIVNNSSNPPTFFITTAAFAGMSFVNSSTAAAGSKSSESDRLSG